MQRLETLQKPMHAQTTYYNPAAQQSDIEGTMQRGGPSKLQPKQIKALIAKNSGQQLTYAETRNHARPALNMQGQTEIPRTDQNKRT